MEIAYSQPSTNQIILMCVMATSLKLKTPSLESFEETYKTAYSHGLEAIYALETVDLKTVRKLVSKSSEQKNMDSKPLFESSRAPEEHSQLEIEFGERFGEWIEPLFLDEPLSVLRLSLQAQASLRAAGVVRLGDLIAFDLNDAVLHKGLGQGHLQEIQSKLHEYRAGRSVEKSDWIDCSSLILSVTDGIPQKKLSFLLKEFDLVELVIPQREFLRQEISFSQDNMGFPNGAQKELCLKKLEKIAKVFLLPWIESKGGLCNEEELIERLENLSVQPRLLRPTLLFLAKYFTAGAFPFTSFLYTGAAGLFSHTPAVVANYLAVVRCAQSYFPSKKERYTLASLKAFIEKEFAKKWIYHDPLFINESLHRSSIFSIFRGPKGILQVCLTYTE